MRSLLRFTDYTEQDVERLFRLANELEAGGYQDILRGKSVILFFPNSSIRTRVTFEKGIALLGGQPVLFPSDALDKKEDLRDVCGYLNNWADMVIVRHKEISVVERMAEYLKVPVINAMTDVNHPCEILSDLYALSKIRKDFKKDRYLFCGRRGNIGLTWKEASEVLGFELAQCCGRGCEIEGLPVYYDINEAVSGRDIVCTDSLPAAVLEEFQNCQVTKEVMDKANPGALLNPCPPFFRGEEVSEDVIQSEYFVGYEFKKSLLCVQQAVMVNCLGAGKRND
ncbi:MAG: peptide transporter [Lachnospiraceae bacterium]|nr:peptide transporter [Lachnospiraceae bacterium]